MFSPRESVGDELDGGAVIRAGVEVAFATPLNTACTPGPSYGWPDMDGRPAILVDRLSSTVILN